ncbi:hypothetical protein [Nonomuraea sp. NPDC050310]|uniref:hypothetical protein n=1 Tax=Nonomuraea sp. NPDC050310 TaxID=3154935 RepID=UPI0034111664
MIEMPEFDVKSTRRAVRRGVARTALRAVAIVVALALVAVIGPVLLQKRSDRADRMSTVLGVAFELYAPAYRLSFTSCCEMTPWSMGMTMSGGPLRAHGGFVTQGGQEYTITQTFFGRVSGHLPLGASAMTTLSYALMNVRTGNQPKEDQRKVLARLPAELRALSVVEFERPLDAAALKAFEARHGVTAERVVYEERPRSIPITWGYDMDFSLPDSQPGDELKNFRAWVDLLREHDDANLRDFDLTLERLRRAAKDGLAYAFVDTLTTVGELRKVIEDPLVRTVRVADLAYDLEKP